MAGRTTRIAALALAAAAATLVAGCGGGERQDTDEAAGEYGFDVTEASFPRRQSLAERATLEIAVRNTGDAALPNVAVTVETARRGAREGTRSAFGEHSVGTDLADAGRPVWIVDREPRGGATAYTNTWALGRLAPGRTARFTWALTPVRGGEFTVSYRVSPGLDARARTTQGSRARGRLRVSISEAPSEPRVTADGEIVSD
jgi:hypothetical protein